MCCSRTLTAICAVEQQLQQQRHKSQPLLPLQDESDGSWQERLRRVLVEARAGRGITSIVRALSVMVLLSRFFGEVVQNADDRAGGELRFALGMSLRVFLSGGGSAFSSRYECTPGVHVSLEVDASYENLST